MTFHLRAITAAILTVLTTLTAQTITVSTDTVRFPSSLSTVTDSLPVWIRNTGSQQVKITDINSFGGVFSASDTAFTLGPKDSVRTWIRFSSPHNLTFTQSLFIETNLTSGTVVLPATGTKTYAEAMYASTQGKSGAALKTVLGTIAASGQTTLGYNTARDRMYGIIDNVGGQVECIYTGRKATFNTRTGATDNNFNCEHTWPQSKFNSLDPMVSDLNHLFSTDETANGKRSNYPFGVVINATWTVGGSKYGNGYNGQITFEPRDEHKGDCARAMLYFITRYPTNYGSFWGESSYQESAMKNWNKQFPPTAKSKARNNAVQQYQGNRNPYIDHPEFADRIYSFTGTADLPLRPVLAASPEVLSHAKRAPGQTLGWWQTFANVGTGTLTVTSAQFSDSAYSLNEPIPQIAPGSFVRIGILYKPTAATIDSITTLTLTYDDGTGAKQTAVTFKAQTVGVLSVASSSLVPSGMTLDQNFPNPFNPSTTIRYTIPTGTKQHVTLRIFDVLGKEVRTLVDAAQESGEYRVPVSMNGLNSGVYFYRLQTDNTVLVRRMLLLK